GAEKAHQFAGWLEQRDPGSVLDEVRDFARQRPLAFLGIALGAGVVTGRLVRGLSADTDTASSTGSANPPAPSRRSVDSAPRVPALDVPPPPAAGGMIAGGDGDGELFPSENPYRAEQADWADRPA